MNKPEVNHLGDKMDNRACMLEWSTHKENCEHSGKYKIHYRKMSVQQIDPKTSEVIKTFDTIADAICCGFYFEWYMCSNY